MKSALAFISYLFYFGFCFGQRSIGYSGVIRDSISREMLPGVTIKVFTRGHSFSLISNREGEFQINLSEKADSVSLSIIGFISKMVKPAAGDYGEWQEIKMTPNPKLLDAVTVRPTPAVEIVKQAIAATIASLPKSNYSAREFYRESINDKDHYFSIAEGIFLTRFNVANHSIKLKLEQGRSKEEVSYTRLFEDFHPGGGPQLGAEESFSIRFPDFLNLKKLERFQYSFAKGLLQDGHSIYCIAFDQREHVKESLEKGRIYINADDYSIIKYEAENSPIGMPYVKNLTGTDKIFAEILNIDLERKAWKRTVGFDRMNNQILLSYANIELRIGYKQSRKGINLDLNIQLEMVMTDPFLPNEKEISKEEEWKRKNLAINLPTAFDSTFWGTHQIISPTEKIRDIISSISNTNHESASKSDIEGWQYINKGQFLVRQQADTIMMSPLIKSTWENDETGGMIYKPANGDFSFESRVRLVKQSDPGAMPDRGFQQAGIIVRNGEGGQENYFLLALGTGGNANPKLFFKRTLENKTKTVVVHEQDLDGIMRVSKTGNKLSAYFKPDKDSAWIKAGEYEIGWLSKKLQVGFVVFSHFPGQGPKMIPDIQAFFYQLKTEGI